MKGHLTKLIDAAILGEDAASPSRDYIGASSIGNPCARQTWYKFKNVAGEPIPRKLQRTFAIGKRLEGLVLDILVQSGLEIVRDWDEFCDREIPIFRGHIDAMLMKPRAIIEVKTARNSSFNIFVKDGLLKWSPTYYAQVQSYMGMSGIHEAYVIALNKDTSELHDEKVLFNAAFYDVLKNKARMISEAEIPPAKISNSPLYFACRSCSFKGVCHSSRS
jgi:hypothetical protein